LGAPSEKIQSLLKNKPASTAELAMRFVLTNPNVDIALSGMSELYMVDENVNVASRGEKLTDEEVSFINKSIEENKELAKLYCTTCNYCKPCPQDINIPYLFGLMNNHRVYELTEHSIFAYGQALRGESFQKSASPEACVECGECERKCPQKLPIVKQLKETHTALWKV
jgi:predicted aldo/keto reductase-like oxidoreductase